MIIIPMKPILKSKPKKKETTKMNYDEEMAVFDDIVAECRNLLTKKGDDYSGREDRLANFKRLAKELGLTPQQVLWVYLRKHLDAITSYVKDGKFESCEGLRSRVVDAVNYLVLMECLRLDEEGKDRGLKLLDEVDKYNLNIYGCTHPGYDQLPLQFGPKTRLDKTREEFGLPPKGVIPV